MIPAHAPESSVLSTDRLRLRPARCDDLDDMHHLVNETSVCRFLFDNRRRSREEVCEMLSASERRFEDTGTGLWALQTRAGEGLIGFLCLRPFHDERGNELAFALSSVHWGKGYALEAGAALIGYVRERLGWKSVQASTDLCNNRSIRTLWRLEFVESSIIHGPAGPLRVFKRMF